MLPKQQFDLSTTSCGPSKARTTTTTCNYSGTSRLLLKDRKRCFRSIMIFQSQSFLMKQNSLLSLNLNTKVNKFHRNFELSKGQTSFLKHRVSKNSKELESDSRACRPTGRFKRAQYRLRVSLVCHFRIMISKP
jgi:hypothetical protein